MTARTMQAHPAGEQQADAVLAHGQSGMPIALLGMLLFIASEVMFFGGLFATYFNARASVAGEWGPPPSAPELEILPVALPITIILVSSSFTMQFAVWAVRKNDHRMLRIWLTVTAVLGAIFLAGQAYEYATLGFLPTNSIFAATFFTLTGFHGLHVLGGLLFIALCLFRALKGHFSAHRHLAVEAASIYWHFVDIVWIGLFTTIYVVG